MYVEETIDAAQARQNMKTTSDGPADAVAALNEAIREASLENRGHTTAFLDREHIDIDDMEHIVKYFRERGFAVEDRCEGRDTFALKISWYPSRQRGA